MNRWHRVALLALLLCGRGWCQEDQDPASIERILDGLRTAPAGAELLEVRAGVHGVLCALPGALPTRERPCVLVVAGLNPDHRTGVRVAARLPQALMDAAAAEPELAELLKRCAVEVIAAPAPDALELAARGPLREQRCVPTPVDDDNDGLVDEDGPEDLNGDGVISMLRAPDPEGAWRCSDEDPRLMVKADASKGERGTWKLVSEGIDNDGDGLINEDAVGGVDLDRNFAHGWKEGEKSVGMSCPSEIASRALLEHVLHRPSIAAVMVLGWRDNLAQLQRTSESAERRAPNGLLADDVHWAKPLTAELAKLLGANEGVEDSADGGFHQWAYAQMGLPAFASRVVYRPELEPGKKLPNGAEPKSTDAKWLLHSDNLGGAGFMPWTSTAHPGWEKAELGGFRPLWNVSMDEQRCAAAVQAQVKAVTAILRALPTVQVEQIAAKDLGGGVHEITAMVAVQGAVPGMTAAARQAHAVHPLLVRFDAGKATLIDGAVLTRIEKLPVNWRRQLRWLVRGDGDLSVSVKAVLPRCGCSDAALKVEGR